jgi:hypothetical protein
MPAFAGVHRYIASDWSGDYRTVELGEVPMKDPMKIIYAYLQDKQAAGSAIRGIYIFNGGFTEALLANVFADDAQRKSITLDLEMWALTLRQCRMLRHGPLRSQWTPVLME